MRDEKTVVPIFRVSEMHGLALRMLACGEAGKYAIRKADILTISASRLDFTSGEQCYPEAVLTLLFSAAPIADAA